MKALDLFSCIGGHSIGLAAAGIETAAFCEKDEWRRGIIARHFPGAMIYDDVYTTPAIAADIYVGGPPCQGTSVGAAIHGTRDGRTLWPAMRRLVSEGSPEWVVVEQPPGNAKWESSVPDCSGRTGFRSTKRSASTCPPRYASGSWGSRRGGRNHRRRIRARPTH